MSDIIEKLSAWGCDTKGAMERMCDDEEFYIECLQDIVDDPYFDTLKKALDSGDISGAFDAAHTLKGVFANVGLTPMYDKVVELVEPLRAGSSEDMSGKYEQLMEMRAYLNDAIKQR